MGAPFLDGAREFHATNQIRFKFSVTVKKNLFLISGNKVCFSLGFILYYKRNGSWFGVVHQVMDAVGTAQ